MPKPQPNRNYEAEGTPPGNGGEAPATVHASLDANREGEGTPAGAPLAQAEDQGPERKKVAAWSFVPVDDGFGEGG
jgi:hypothetical protein